MAIDPSIAMGYRGLGELPNPMNQLAQVSQIQSSQRQGEMAQMQIQQMRRDETALTQFYADVAKNGGPTNPVEIEDAMINSGVRDIVNSGLTARMTRSKLENQQKQFAGIMGARMPTGAPMAAPAAAAVPEPGSFGADVAARAAAVPAWAQNNALAPTAAPTAPANALMAGGEAVDALRQKRNALLSLGTSQAIAAAKALDADIALAAKEPVYHNVTGVGLVNPRDKSVVVPSVEAAPNSIRELEAFMKMTPQQQDTFMKMKRASAGGTTVVMPPLEKTEQQEKGKLNVKVYGDIAGTADRARKILPALETSEAILNNGFKTGFGTDVQTQAARVLSSLGVPEADKYATNSQLFLAQGRQALLQRQLEQKGAQSEGDAQRINQTFIQLGNTPEANKFLVATAKAQAKQDIERQKF